VVCNSRCDFELRRESGIFFGGLYQKPESTVGYLLFDIICGYFNKIENKLSDKNSYKKVLIQPPVST